MSRPLPFPIPLVITGTVPYHTPSLWQQLQLPTQKTGAGKLFHGCLVFLMQFSSWKGVGETVPCDRS